MKVPHAHVWVFAWFAAVTLPAAADCDKPVPSDLRWSEPYNGVSLGVPAHPVTFRLHGSMLVTIVVKNVGKKPNDDGMHALCLSMRAVDRSGAKLALPEAPVPVCAWSVPVGPIPPNYACSNSYDLANWFVVTKPGRYTVFVSNDVGAKATFELNVVPHW